MSGHRPWVKRRESVRADFSPDEQRSLFLRAADDVDDPVDRDALHAAGEVVWWGHLDDQLLVSNENVKRWLDQLWRDFV